MPSGLSVTTAAENFGGPADPRAQFEKPYGSFGIPRKFGVVAMADSTSAVRKPLLRSAGFGCWLDCMWARMSRTRIACKVPNGFRRGAEWHLPAVEADRGYFVGCGTWAQRIVVRPGRDSSGP